jgi:twitching motility protein PilJ
MSAIDQIKNLFSRAKPQAEIDASLSLAMPDQGMDAESPETVQVPQPSATASPSKAQAVAPAAQPVPVGDLVALPVLGARPVAQQLRLLGVMLGLSLLSLAGVTAYVLQQTESVALQVGASGQALMQSQRLAKSVSPALGGNATALADVADSAAALAQATQGLRSDLAPIAALVEQTGKNAQGMLQQQKALTRMGGLLRNVGQQSTALLDAAQRVLDAKVQQNAAAAEIAAAGQLLMLTQRLGKGASQLLAAEGSSAETAALLGQDLKAFHGLVQALLNGSTELHLAPARDASTRDPLEALAKLAEAMPAQGDALLADVPALLAARTAQLGVLTDSEALRHGLEALQNKLSAHSGIGNVALAVLALATALALLSAAGLSSVQKQDSRRRHAVADNQRLEAERLEQDAKRVNDANQAAILRLMNELQTVAEGDLTQEATVTEDITGAIADSVNYTVEELRSLVGNVQKTAAQVAQTTSDVDATSTELLAASKEQLHEIRETGQSVLEMAGRINDVSAQAQESARVARQSLLAAETGFQAVQNAIGGMNSIREQIQETSKRIKRLGESSQEIGEITELISDITEQTNVLALNAAIQAASAGDAGRGFSVVAEEVQRLAERSADATRQIAALVKAIQTDTQDAIGAMERSTQGVVEGAKLSDNAGTALTEIDRVSRRVADLIEQISNSASREAGLANEVAENIQHIFAVTEQTGEGTRVTAGQVRELSRMAEELRQSVSRFKIA